MIYRRHKYGPITCYVFAILNIRIHFHVGRDASIPETLDRKIRLRSVLIGRKQLPLKYYSV